MYRVSKKNPTFTCLSNMFLNWRNFSIGLHINWFNCFVLVGDDYKGTNNFNDSNHVCENYKKESGSRCTYQSNEKIKVMSSNTKKGDQVSQFYCNINGIHITQHTNETPISSIGTQGNINQTSKKQSSSYRQARPHSGSNSRELKNLLSKTTWKVIFLTSSRV